MICLFWGVCLWKSPVQIAKSNLSFLMTSASIAIRNNYMNSRITNYIIIAVATCSLLISIAALLTILNQPTVGRYSYSYKEKEDDISSKTTLRIFDSATGDLYSHETTFINNPEDGLPDSMNRSTIHTSFQKLKYLAATNSFEIIKLRQRKR